MSLVNNLTKVNIEQTVCKGSTLSIFTLLKYFGRIQISRGRAEKIRNLATKGPEMINEVLEFFDELRNSSTLDLDGTIPPYLKNPFDKKYRKPKPSEDVEVKEARTMKTSEKERAETSVFDQLDLLTILLKRLNNLKNISPENCPVQRFEDKDDVDKLLVDSTTKSCFCQNIYSIIDRLSKITSQLFSQLKPLFLGKVLYSPNTTAYNELIDRMNTTFESVDQFGVLLYDMSILVENFRLEVIKPENANSVNFVLGAINVYVNQTGLNITIPFGLDIPTISTQLLFVSELLLFSHNSIYCVELDKFRGYPTEDAAVDVGLNLIDKESFWAAMIFTEPQINNVTLPKIVKYKIRMNSSQVHNTLFTQDRFYQYEPSNCLGCNAYFTYGFIYLQDILEKSIKKLLLII